MFKLKTFGSNIQIHCTRCSINEKFIHTQNILYILFNLNFNLCFVHKFLVRLLQKSENDVFIFRCNFSAFFSLFHKTLKTQNLTYIYTYIHIRWVLIFTAIKKTHFTTQTELEFHPQFKRKNHINHIFSVAGPTTTKKKPHTHTNINSYYFS